MPKLNLNKKELAALDVALKDSSITMGSISPTNKALIMSVKSKLHKVLTADVKPAKPLSKKHVKSILKTVMPKGSYSDRSTFLSALQQNINTVFN